LTIRVLHLVTHLSPDRRFGGPNTVALTQARALLRLGIEVVIAGGAEGFPVGAGQIDGVSVKLFPSRQVVGSSWAFRAAPGLTSWVRKVEKQFDLAHVHVARDLTTLPLAATLSIPTVLQPHGMILPSNAIGKRAYDRLWGQRAFKRAKAVIALNEDELKSLRERFSFRESHILPNSIEDRDGERPSNRDFNTVLFLARLNTRKRPQDFVNAARELLRSGSKDQFLLAGTDDGMGANLREMLRHENPSHIRVLGPVEGQQVRATMARADLYVLPAVSEPFGMTLLEALSVGTPVLARRDSILGIELSRLGLAKLYDGDARCLAIAIQEALSDAKWRRSVNRDAPAIIQRHWGSGYMAQKLAQVYAGGTKDARSH
jgi:glycosyltransferase involved in cell wall biosynthesis